MDDVDEDMILSRELRILADESMKNHCRVKLHDNEARVTMALAQVVQCNAMMKFYVETEWDWRRFKRETGEVLEMQQTLYREARAADDREWARITLARVRLLTTLTRRLGDGTRRAAFARTVHSQMVWH